MFDIRRQLFLEDCYMVTASAGKLLYKQVVCTSVYSWSGYHNIAILKYESFHSWCCLVNRKVKPFKQTVFLSEQCAVSNVTASVRGAVFRPWQRPTVVLLVVCCPVDDTLSEVSLKIRRSGVSSRYYGNHATGSKPIKKKLFTTSIENWIRSTKNN